MNQKSQVVPIRMTEKEIETLRKVVAANNRGEFWTKTPGRTLRSIVDLVTNAWDNDSSMKTTQIASGSDR
jgi:hypothetical protein